MSNNIPQQEDFETEEDFFAACRRNRQGNNTPVAKRIETTKKPWVFWLSISIRRKWFSKYWTTRGANYFEMQLWIFHISIGRPWIKSEHFGYDYVKKANIENLRNPFSLLIGRYFFEQKTFNHE